MKSGGLLSSNLPNVINLSNLSPHRDRLMTQGKLLDNNTTLFIFYFYSNDDPRDQEKKQQNWFSEWGFSEETSYNRLNMKAWLTAVVWLSANNTLLVSVDLIGEKNQVFF